MKPTDEPHFSVWDFILLMGIAVVIGVVSALILASN